MFWTPKELIDKLKEAKESDIYELKKKRKKTLMSDAQRRYYFWVIVEITADFHWHTPVEQHELLKTWFKLKSTTGLAMDEYAAMCNMIIDLYNVKFKVVIPLPRDSDEEQSLMDSLWF